jgi:hypothetical protein
MLSKLLCSKNKNKSLVIPKKNDGFVSDFQLNYFDIGELNPNDYDLVEIKKAYSNLKMYKAIFKCKKDNKIFIDAEFGTYGQKIYKDKTKLKLYKDQELLSYKQRNQFRKLHEDKIKKKYSTYWLIRKYLI